MSEVGSSGYSTHSLAKNDFQHLISELREQNFDSVRFATYRAACKLRFVQKKVNLHLVDIWNVIESFRENGLNAVDSMIEVKTSRIELLLSTMYHNLNKRLPVAQQIDTDRSIALLLSFLLGAYDREDCGKLRVFSLKVALGTLCAGKLLDKLRYIFSQISEPSGVMDYAKFVDYLKEVLALPTAVFEGPTFGFVDTLPKSCFTMHTRVTVNSFLDTLMADPCPPCLMWLPLLHRMASTEHVFHPVVCDACGKDSFSGFRYRCQRCSNYQICQDCFWRGRTSGSHTNQHEMKEYSSYPAGAAHVQPAATGLLNGHGGHPDDDVNDVMDDDEEANARIVDNMMMNDQYHVDDLRAAEEDLEFENILQQQQQQQQQQQHSELSHQHMPASTASASQPHQHHLLPTSSGHDVMMTSSGQIVTSSPRHHHYQRRNSRRRRQNALRLDDGPFEDPLDANLTLAELPLPPVAPRSPVKQLGHSINKSLRCAPGHVENEHEIFPEQPDRPLDLSNVVPATPTLCRQQALKAAEHGAAFYDDLPMDSSVHSTLGRFMHSDSAVDDEHKLIARYSAKLAGRTQYPTFGGNEAAQAAAAAAGQMPFGAMSMYSDETLNQRALIARLEQRNREILSEIQRLQAMQAQQAQFLAPGVSESGLSSELDALRQRKVELEDRMRNLQETRHDLMAQLDHLMRILKTQPGAVPMDGQTPRSPASLSNIGGDIAAAFRDSTPQHYATGAPPGDFNYGSMPRQSNGYSMSPAPGQFGDIFCPSDDWLFGPPIPPHMGQQQQQQHGRSPLPSSVPPKTGTLQGDLLSAADNITNTMGSLMRELGQDGYQPDGSMGVPYQQHQQHQQHYGAPHNGIL